MRMITRFLVTVVATAFCLVTAGCLGPAKFDVSNKETIEKSTNRIVEGLSEAERAEFIEALKYYSKWGNTNIFEDNGAQNDQNSIVFGKAQNFVDDIELAAKLKFLDGLTGMQIIEKYRIIVDTGMQKMSK